MNCVSISRNKSRNKIVGLSTSLRLLGIGSPPHPVSVASKPFSGGAVTTPNAKGKRPAVRGEVQSVARANSCSYNGVSEVEEELQSIEKSTTDLLDLDIIHQEDS